MHLTRFFRLGWIIQLLVGIALFSVSFLVELAVLENLLGQAPMAWVLASALELGKATAIIWHRYLRDAPATAYPTSTRLISGGFRIGLVALSILCSLLYIGVQVDRPHLEQVRAAELHALDIRVDAELRRLEAEAAAGSEQLERRQREALAALHALHEPRIAGLESQLRAEMDNVVGGTFKGQRYQAIQERSAQARAELAAAVRELAARQAEETAARTAALAETHARSRAVVEREADARRAAIRTASFDTDDRANHPLVVSFIRTLETVTGLAITPPLFALGLAFFLAVLMELGILVAFEIVTLVMLPALSAQHREEVTTEALMAEITGSADREALRHREAVERVRKSAEHVVEKAQTYRDAA